MMGPKKLRTIRQELDQALASTGQDPIRWLEKRMTAAEQATRPSEVLHSLRRLLDGNGKKKPGRPRAGTRK
jgi:hypothetical protein